MLKVCRLKRYSYFRWAEGLGIVQKMATGADPRRTHGLQSLVPRSLLLLHTNNFKFAQKFIN